jgi:hypothetical protein
MGKRGRCRRIPYPSTRGNTFMENVWGIILITAFLILPYRIVMDLRKQKENDDQ